MSEETETVTCMICGKQFEMVVRYCCDGHECGCMGRPIDPPICDSECWKAFKTADRTLALIGADRETICWWAESLIGSGNEAVD